MTAPAPWYWTWRCSSTADLLRLGFRVWGRHCRGQQRQRRGRQAHLFQPGILPRDGRPDLTYNGGNDDVFVAKVRANGTGLEFCGFLGGTNDDYGYGIAVDSSGNAYVTGHTRTADGSFQRLSARISLITAVTTPLSPRCGRTVRAWPTAASSAARLLTMGLALLWTTVVTPMSRAAQIPPMDRFRRLSAPDLGHNGGMRDAFVAKVRADGTSLTYCGFLGGTGYDQGHGIAVDSSGNAYVTGDTDSSAGIALPGFPVAVGLDLSHNGGNDAFTAKVRADGIGLVWAVATSAVQAWTSGAGYRRGQQRQRHVTGTTTSTEIPFQRRGWPGT